MTMPIHEVRDAEVARRYVLQGLLRQSVLPPSPETVASVLEWALEIVSGGEPLPPPGFLADLGHLAFGTTLSHPAPELPPLTGWTSSITRTYEDYVLGKLYADASFERGAAAMCRYQGRDRARGLAFLVSAFRERAGFAGVVLSPAVVKSLVQKPDDLLTRAWESLERDGLLPILPALYEDLSRAARNAGAVLAAEDVFELEHRTALMQFGERLELRQVLQAAAQLEAAFPHHVPRRAASRQEVPTHLLDEDRYPVGGFSSISTRGSIESLLHSQLAYMDRSDRPDLFDLKFLRDELLYYSRDENQFLRRRRSFVFVLFSDLHQTRIKDAELPWQRIVLSLAVVVAAVRQLTDWLSEDALSFQIVFPGGRDNPLAAERKLLELVFREQIANGTVAVEALPLEGVAPLCRKLARRSLCHALTLSPAERTIDVEGVAAHRLRILARPELVAATDRPGQLPTGPDDNTPLEAWQSAATRWLRECV